MVNPGGIRGGGGPHFQPRVSQDAVPKKETKETRDSKGAKGAEGKADVKGGGQAGGVKAKGKAKSKDMAGVDALVGGSDNYAVEDDPQEQRRRRRQNFFDEPDQVFSETITDTEVGILGAVNAEFRAQVAQGLAAGRTFTRGGMGHPGVEGEEEEQEEEAPKKQRRRA